MKHLKIIAMLAVATAAMLAFAANASAAKFTSPTGTEYGVGKTIEATSTNGQLTGAFVTVTCSHSLVKNTISSQTASDITLTVNSLTFTGCNFPVSVKKTGTLTVTPTSTGNEVNGTVTSTGAEVSIETSLGTCVFTTSNTDIATFTGGIAALLDIKGTIPRTGGNFLCGSSATWEGTFSVLTPDELWLDKS